MSRPWKRASASLARSPAVMILAVVGLCLPACYWAMFSSFARWDDEGYVLITLREYARGKALYDQVYSEYGPAFYQFLSGLFAICRLDFTHDTGRWFTMWVWLVTPALCAVATYRLTRNSVVTVCAQMLVFLGLSSLAREPPHPGGCLSLTLGLLAVAGSFLDGPRSTVAAAAIGVLVAAAVLMKINVGGFALAASVFALSATARAGRGRRAVTAAAAMGICLMPALLMASLWTADWVPAFCAVVSCSVAAVVVTQLSHPPRSPGTLRNLWVLLLACALAGAAACALTLARGTSLSSLVHGVLLNPMNHPHEFYVPLKFSPWAPWWALFSATGALVIALDRRAVRSGQRFTTLLAPLQLAAGAVIWLVAAQYLPVKRFSGSLPLLWVAILPAAASEPSRSRERGEAFLVSLAALQTLHAYPVAGSHQWWSTFLYIPVGAIALTKGLRGTAATAQRWFDVPPARRVAWTALAAVAVIVTTARVAIYQPARQASLTYEAGVPLDLPGAERIRLPQSDVMLYHWLTSELSSRCKTFISLPGLNSLYFFTGIEPPTFMNTTHWMTMFSPAQQIAIRDRFARTLGPRCAVRNRDLVDFWTHGQDFSDGPLVRYIDSEFVTVATREGYEFMMQREDIAREQPGGPEGREPSALGTR